MTLLVAATGAGAWMLLGGAAVAGLAFGMLINTVLAGRRRRK
jgi:hypothetical protein